ncbi:MAG: tetratricopeptide repeat protein, partial [Gammaproteobacteria bacterium]|nr:tetratricopeptide repeat protein [Gammaproteobacteria bacterium]
MREGIPSCCHALIAVIGLVATASAQQADQSIDAPPPAVGGRPAAQPAEPATTATPTDIPQPPEPEPAANPTDVPEPADDELADRPILPEAEPTEPTGETLEPRLAAHQRMLDLAEEERFDEAVGAAQQVVKLTEEEFGPDSLELASPIDNLATVQMLNGDLVDAEGNYQRSIALIERREGILSKRLINPYIGLGAT